PHGRALAGVVARHLHDEPVLADRPGRIHAAGRSGSPAGLADRALHRPWRGAAHCAAALHRPDHRRRQARSITAFPDPQRMLVAGNPASIYRLCALIQQARGPRVHERWAHLRFSVIGQLLAAPPPKGELRAEIEALAGRQWRHPTTGDPARFGFSTIERWYYRALKERSDPVGVLRRKTAHRCRPAARDA